MKLNCSTITTRVNKRIKNDPPTISFSLLLLSIGVAMISAIKGTRFRGR
ncbi:hypothetical protein MPF_1351 [Methanohalophilus portucalensis FDF-1]|uniref:Uncharacterized protein n=1 Tax=Methanohalophilus portucalensis FDF-1 TaxID=523843 RepID=A0A1L9C4M7_9EURY|nr:hypothetical protein MPF_1351 [Methanohalophilus portucalensis FDF-1]